MPVSDAVVLPGGAGVARRRIGAARSPSPSTLSRHDLSRAAGEVQSCAGLALFYATRDGQARLVAERIAARLAETGLGVTPHDLAAAFPVPAACAAAALIVVVAAVRYGRHLPEAERFLAAYRVLPRLPPLVFVSVNLTARKPGKDTVEGNRYLRKTLTRHRLEPALAAAVAGRLDYPRYGWFDRQMIRLIMKLTGGPTDPQTRVEFTDWAAVDVIGARIAALHAPVPGQGVI